MNNINANQAISHWLENYLGLESYQKIMDSVHKVDVTTDQDFQRVFNGFYRVRRNEEWRKAYYSVFEEMKSGQATFDTILQALYEMTGMVEASFSSKMLATLNSNEPIWDKYVLQNLGIEVPGINCKKRIFEVEDCYRQIEEWYCSYLQSANAKECIQKFDEILPAYSWLSDVKKIDFYLWSIRGD